MAKNLVIIEAFGKVKKFKEYLGSNYHIIASGGHIFDLPQKELGVDLKNNFKTEFVTIDSKKKDILQEIVKEAKKAENIYLMSDLDREGCAISALIYDHLKDIIDPSKIKRATANAITKDALNKAINNAYDISKEDNMVEAFNTRRVLDRLCGYKTSYIVFRATGGKSAGRCQSSGLRILAEREKEIQAFIPVAYWPIEADLITGKNETIHATIETPKSLEINTEKQANEIIERLKKGPISVSKYDVKTVALKPSAPFTTSSLQQTAATVLGFAPKKTMAAAQALYAEGRISYHRTDSTTIIPEELEKIRKYVNSSYGAKYLPPKANIYSTKVANAQEAHEACRPTDITISSVTSLGIDEKKLYELIWRRTVACQMSSASYERRSADFTCDNYVLRANGSKELFDGFRKVWTYSEATDRYLPDLVLKEIVKATNLTTEEKKTSPPPRYSEGSFVKELETRGIGRPATYAAIVETLKDREYVTSVGGKAFEVTELGMKVNDFLVGSNFCFADIDFTGKVEEKLDEIANGKLNKNVALNEFWDRLKADIANAGKVKQEAQKTDYVCPNCNSPLVKRTSKNGAFYGCSLYGKKGSDCKYIANIGEDGKPVEKVAKEYKESEHKCPNCKEPLIIKQGKKSEYLACRNWKDKDCAGFFGLDGVKWDFSAKKTGEKKFKKWKKVK